MKKFLKRANRGLILAACAAAGVAVFTLADSAAFAEDQPKLEELTREYLEEVKKVSLSDADDRTARAKALVDGWWCDTGESYSANGALKDEMLSYIENAQEQPEITGFSEVERSLRVTKNGFGSAKAVVEYDVSMELDPVSNSYQILGLESGYYSWGDAGAAKALPGESTKGTLNKSLALNLYFYEKDGEWKLGCADAAEAGMEG